MTPIFLEMLLDRDITEPDAAAVLAAAILETVPDIFPDRVGNYEPIREHCTSAADLRRYWVGPVLGKQARPRSTLGVYFRASHRRFTAISLSVSDSRFTSSSLAPLLARIGRDFDAAYGMIQAVSPSYRSRGDHLGVVSYVDSAKKRPLIILRDESIANGVPDVFDYNWLPVRMWRVPPNTTSVNGLYVMIDGSDAERDRLKNAIHKVA